MYFGRCVYKENTCDKWDIPCGIPRDRERALHYSFYTMPYTINAIYVPRIMERLDVKTVIYLPSYRHEIFILELRDFEDDTNTSKDSRRHPKTSEDSGSGNSPDIRLLYIMLLFPH